MPASRLLIVPALALALGACGSDNSDSGDSPAGSMMGTPQPQTTADVPDENVLSGTFPRLNGEPQDLAAYRGKVVLVVNTATECGFTPQFESLEELYEQRRADGFVILGFPADDVAGQEPRSDEEIAEFCRANFGVSFPMFAKSNVVNDPVNPVFAALGAELGEPSWNFNKYLLDRRGRPVEHFDETVEPDSPELGAAINAQLQR